MNGTKVEIELKIEDNSEEKLRIRLKNKHSNCLSGIENVFSNNLKLHNLSTLDLSNCDLEDLPRSIKNLPLKYLIASHNRLREVPVCIYSGLNNLEVVDLSYNLIENFDVEPACSQSIRKLIVNNNYIYNLPNWILLLQCPNLHELCYSNNKLRDLRTYQMVHLRKIEMCNCCLIDVDFPFFKRNLELEYLDISNNVTKICENRFRNIDDLFSKARWTKLAVLKLNNLHLSIIPQDIFWFSSITQLYLKNCDLSWISKDVQYLVNLETLNVSENTICALPPQLACLKNLRVVQASYNNIASVPDFPHLHLLDLYNNCLETAPDVQNVELVDLEHNYFKTDLEFESKKLELRAFLGVQRHDGPLDRLPEMDDDDDGIEKKCGSWSSDEGSTNGDDLSSCEEDEECWDDVPKIIYVKNPVVTESDEEWNPDDVIAEKKEKTEENVEEEKWLFVDAD